MAAGVLCADMLINNYPYLVLFSIFNENNQVFLFKYGFLFVTYQGKERKSALFVAVVCVFYRGF